jgi:hypothetical protein
MRTAIVQRIQRDGITVRVLECGHEQRERLGGHSASALEAFCRQCGAGRARTATRKTAPTRPVDVRSELQRLADDVERTWHFPAGRAWGLGDVAVRKLVDAARKHSCAVPPAEVPHDL